MSAQSFYWLPLLHLRYLNLQIKHRTDLHRTKARLCKQWVNRSYLAFCCFTKSSSKCCLLKSSNCLTASFVAWSTLSSSNLWGGSPPLLWALKKLEGSYLRWEKLFIDIIMRLNELLETTLELFGMSWWRQRLSVGIALAIWWTSRVIFFVALWPLFGSRNFSTLNLLFKALFFWVELAHYINFGL